MKTLIVDDDSQNRDVLAYLLKETEEVAEAVNGQEAITFYSKSCDEKKPFDLILLDIMMPEIDGHETLLKIREYEEQKNVRIGDGVKIIMVTALDDGLNFTKSFREGCEGFVIKPVTKNNLFSLINKLGL